MEDFIFKKMVLQRRLMTISNYVSSVTSHIDVNILLEEFEKCFDQLEEVLMDILMTCAPAEREEYITEQQEAFNQFLEIKTRFKASLDTLPSYVELTESYDTTSQPNQNSCSNVKYEQNPVHTQQSPLSVIQPVVVILRFQSSLSKVYQSQRSRQSKTLRRPIQSHTTKFAPFRLTLSCL